ncbi:hypothetical protein TRFO_15677 [Tritrichomonas foetus]|uniref:TerD domain-containing protein n=1 Tax=Tritrichomonas foetus TaxID=1144522 RepID=A0A1J4KWV5_9EUKA|nr:hypothetical protein TRFO_15677 [Tritrichomonas foetus]|eukprot:OHT14021.1 hypothetical protein TRFO_15677 [Tritrichomonas foetus]
MLNLYVVKGLDLPKGETINVIVDYIKKDKSIYRLGETGPVGFNKSSNTWPFDEERKTLFFYPFVDFDDMTICLTLKAKSLLKKKEIGSTTINLNEIKYNEEYGVSINIPDSKQMNPQVFIYAETYFERYANILKSKPEQNANFGKSNKDVLKKNNYFYVYIECQKLSKGSSKAELQIYEHDIEDGGYSNLIGKTTSKKIGSKTIIKKQITKNPITSNGCTQLFYFDVNEIRANFRYIPLIRIHANPGRYFVNYVLYSFDDLPEIEQDKDGIYKFNSLIKTPFEPNIVLQDIVDCAYEDLYTGYKCFSFNENKFIYYSIQQMRKNNRELDDYTLELRKNLSPRGLSVFKRIYMSPNTLYHLKELCDSRNRHFSERIMIHLSWQSDADLDLSICALNKNLDCVGHVSFKDTKFFKADALQHIEQFRDENPENGGIEKAMIKLTALSYQVKTILITITSYSKTPFNKVSPGIKILDANDNFELLFYQLSSIEAKTGLLFAAFQRAPKHMWYLVPLLKYNDETKPYDAHRVFIESLKHSNSITEFIQKNLNK